MLGQAEDALITRVEGDAPMGRLLRDTAWIPAIRAARLNPGDAPVALRLVGRDYFACRAADGRIGLRDAAGAVLRRERIEERGGLIWVYLGARATPPAFPDLEFTRKRAENLVAASCMLPCNWVRAVDGALEAAHIGILHRAFTGGMAGRRFGEVPPIYQVQRTPFGLEAAAIRTLPDGTQMVRTTMFVMPFIALPGPSSGGATNRTALISVPIDDFHTRQWFIRFSSTDGPCDTGLARGIGGADIDDFAPQPGPAGGPVRQHMLADLAIQLRQAAGIDRVQAHLTSSQLAGIHFRKLLLHSLRDGGRAPPSGQPGINFAALRAMSAIVPQQQNWREAV